MRKLLVIPVIGIFGLMLAGCSMNKKPVELTFDKSYKVFVKNELQNWENQDFSSLFGGTRENNSEINVKTDTTGTGGKLQVVTSGIANQDRLISNSNSQVKLNINMGKQKIDGSLNMGQIQSLSGKQYLKLKDFSFNMGSGNMQAQVIAAMVQPILNKWIEIDILNNTRSKNFSPTDMKGIAEDIAKILGNIKKLPKILEDNIILENLGETTFEKNLAYKVRINNEAVYTVIKDVLEGTSLEENSEEKIKGNIEGFLIVKDSDNVELLLNNFDGNTTMSVLIQKNVIIIKNREETKDTPKRTLEIQASPDKVHFDFDLKGDKAGKKLEVEVEGKLKFDFSDTKMISSFTAEAKIKTPELHNIFGKDELEIDIAAKSIAEKTDKIVSPAPNGALLFSQLLSDNFGLPHMTGANNLGMNGNYEELTGEELIVKD